MGLGVEFAGLKVACCVYRIKGLGLGVECVQVHSMGLQSPKPVGAHVVYAQPSALNQGYVAYTLGPRGPY